MEIKLVEGATTFEAAKYVLQEIDASDINCENLVVVPDAFSMQAESLIFDCLKTKATFNIEVVGISRLAGKILYGANIPYTRISSLEEIFAIHKAIKNCENSFQYFSHCGVDLSLKILQVIKQFKACKVDFGKYKNTKDESLDRKMHDLILIYDEYQKVLGERLDLSKLLDFFVESTQNTQILSNINLFFINFDSFSLEIGDFICRLAGQVKSITVGMAKPICEANAFIYEDDIQRKILKLAKTYGVNVQVQNKGTSLSGPQLAMVKNLFAFNAEKCDAKDYFFTIKAKNSQDEAVFAAKYIKNQIFGGMRYRDFAVAVPDQKYFELLRETFAKFKIPLYCDDAVNLTQTILGRFLTKVLSIAKNGFDMPSFQYLCSSPLFDRKSDIGDIFKYQISTEKIFAEHFPEFKAVLNKFHLLKHCKRISEYCNILKDFLNFVHENYANYLSKLESKSYFKKESENAQAEDLLLAVMDKLSEISIDEEYSLVEFENILLLAMNSIKVETVPSFVDAVYVGDATESYFQDVKELFVLGANAGSLPKMQSDTAIIDDEDIKKLKLNFVLEPEIKVLNRRNRLKIFELLQHAQNRLFISFPLNVDGKPSQQADFVKNLQEIFGEKSVHTKVFDCIDFSQENIKNLLMFIGSKQNLVENISKIDLPIELKRQIFQLVDKNLPHEQKFETASQISKAAVSASEFETFFACPFKRFVRYVLKINPNEDVLPNNRLFGNFVHSLLHKFFMGNQDIKNIDEKKIQKFLNDNLKNLASQVYDPSVIEKPGFLRQIERECGIILKNVVEEQKNSDFQPVMYEEKIVEDIAGKKLVGFVDRVDKFKDKFRIIDYKTGQFGTIKKELFHGKKLQLFLYADAISKKLNMECAGVYYFNCHSKFKKKSEKEKLLFGMTLKDEDVVYATDKRLLTQNCSDIVGISVKKSAKKEEFPFKGNGLEANLGEYIDYSKKISTLALEQMEEGYIESKPLTKECENCPYRSVCCHDESDGERKFLKV